MWRTWISLLSISVFVCTSTIAGNTKYILVGGGPTPPETPYATEEDARQFLLTGEPFFDPESLTVLFASGNGDFPDVRQLTRHLSDEEELFDLFNPNTLYLESEFRHHSLGEVTGPSTKDAVLAAFTEAQENKWKRLRSYFVSHGEIDYGTGNHTLLLWDDTPLIDIELINLLDKLNPKTHVQMLMVQCFPEGFAKMNFVGGDPGQGLSPANRCAFFSQLRHLPSQIGGIDPANREEYSAYFFAALNGADPAGNPVDADLDGTGTVTSKEAHAYAIMEENTINIPTTTSASLLRSRGAKLKITQDDKDNFWSIFKRQKRPIETAIIKRLEEHLGVALWETPNIFKTIERAVIDLRTPILRLAFAISNNSRQFSALKSKVSWSLQRKNLFFVRRIPLTDISLETADAALQLTTEAQYVDLLELYKNREQLSQDLSELWYQKTKWARLAYLLDTILYESALYRSDLKEWKKKYNQLKRCEAKPYFQ